VLNSTADISRLDRAFAAGAERVSAWAELLDRINVFPVTDYDTGRNLVISLSPLLRLDSERPAMIKNLLLYSRGNSGIIASRFISEALKARSIEELGGAFRRGRESAWKSIADPRPGTMLSIFDALVEILEASPLDSGNGNIDRILDRLERAVQETPEYLPKLKQAGVVDSGALGMFIYLEGFFRSLEGNGGKAFRPITSIFNRHITISSAYEDDSKADYCVSAVFEKSARSGKISRELSSLGDSIIILEDGENDFVKVHFHTDNEVNARRKVESLGRVLEWNTDDIAAQKENWQRSGPAGGTDGTIHILTDAAGSLTRDLAGKFGITLLNSYITYGNRCLPETHVEPSDLYRAMRNEVRASTSQASVFERSQYYQSALELYGKALYLCVGSVYTGNYDAAQAWKNENDQGDDFIVIDTGAASGRLAIMALSCARFLQGSPDMETLLEFARWTVEGSSELIFIDKLQYLAAGGRLSKTGAFFGDLINMKPVISPFPDGARKVGAVRSQSDQVKFALDKISEAKLEAGSGKLYLMLEYTDNAQWLEQELKPRVEKELPGSEIILQPMSLTTGVHVGPGAWGIAWQPVLE
jgi:uncharacterized protein